MPVNPHREVAEQIAPYLKNDCLCVSIAKGLDELGQTAAEIFKDVFAPKQYALLYGPMISEEIRAGRYAFAQLGCDSLHTYQKIRHLYQDTDLYIEHTTDITGISWSVILKNVYALVFGMADELQLGDNMRGYLAFAALRELEQIVHKMGGQEGSPYHLAGLGDLITTATSKDSHHHELGRLLAREVSERATGENMAGESIAGEGIHTLAIVTQYQLFNTEDYPLFQLINNIVEQPQAVNEKIRKYLKQAYS